MPEPLRVRRLGEDDAAAIGEFFRAASWDPNATAADAREMLRSGAADNPFEPGIGPPTVGAFVGIRLVGFITSIPTRFWDGEQYAPGHWLRGYTVLEEYRNGLVAYLLLKEMLKHVGVAASLPGSLPALKLSTTLGMKDLGAVRDYLAPLRPGHILSTLDIGRFEHLKALPHPALAALRIAKRPPFSYAAGVLIELILAALRLPSVMSGRALTTQLGERLPNEAALDRLWGCAQRARSCTATRSGAYLHWRYGRSAQAQYRFASAWRGEDLVGLAVLAHPQRREDSRISGLGIGSVVDLLLDPSCPGALTRVLRVARSWAISSNYDALLLTASHSSLRRALLRAGYLKMPGNIHLLLRDPGGRYSLSLDLDEWMVTRGDGWGDHV